MCVECKPMASTMAFVVALQQQLERCPLDERSQAALLDAVTTAAQHPDSRDDGDLTKWIGAPPSNPVQLEFETLRKRFSLRRELLSSTIGTAEVTNLLGARSRQTAHDRIKAGTLLAIRDQGHWRFPLWQFDPDGPDGLIEHLTEVLSVLRMSELAKLRWLQRPQPVFEGATPIDWLRQGHVDEVLAEARQVGRGQD